MMPQINAIVKTVSLSMLSFAKAVWNLVIGLIISIYLLASKERFGGIMVLLRKFSRSVE